MNSEYFNWRTKLAISITISHLKNKLIRDKHIAYNCNIPFGVGFQMLCEWNASSFVTEIRKSYKVSLKRLCHWILIASKNLLTVSKLRRNISNSTKKLFDKILKFFLKESEKCTFLRNRYLLENNLIITYQ